MTKAKRKRFVVSMSCIKETKKFPIVRCNFHCCNISRVEAEPERAGREPFTFRLTCGPCLFVDDPMDTALLLALCLHVLFVDVYTIDGVVEFPHIPICRGRMPPRIHAPLINPTSPLLFCLPPPPYPLLHLPLFPSLFFSPQQHKIQGFVIVLFDFSFIGYNFL